MEYNIFCKHFKLILNLIQVNRLLYYFIKLFPNLLIVVFFKHGIGSHNIERLFFGGLFVYVILNNYLL
jgi:hypothetical protein